MWAPFKKWAPLIRLPLLPKQLYKLETFISSYKFVFLLMQHCLEKLCARDFLNGICIAKIVSLV